MANHNSNWLRTNPITRIAKAICESTPGEVLLAAAGGFLGGENDVPKILLHVLALLKSSRLPQAVFFGKDDILGII